MNLEIYQKDDILQVFLPLYVALPHYQKIRKILSQYGLSLPDKEIAEGIYKDIVQCLRYKVRKTLEENLVENLHEELTIYEDYENALPYNIKERLCENSRILFSDHPESLSFVANCRHNDPTIDETILESEYVWGELEQLILDVAPIGTEFRCTMGFYNEDGKPAIEVTRAHLCQAAGILVDFAESYDGDPVIHSSFFNKEEEEVATDSTPE